MRDIIYVIKFCGNLITSTYLTFGQWRFSILHIFVCFAAIVIISSFVKRIFSA